MEAIYDIRCMPWYLPPVESDIRLCSPFEARDFSNEMDMVDEDKCSVRISTLILKNDLIKL